MKYFMAAIEARIVSAYQDTVKRGNIWFNAKKLTKAVLEEAKAKYCKSNSNEYTTYEPEYAYITFVCEIDPPE